MYPARFGGTGRQMYLFRPSINQAGAFRPRLLTFGRYDQIFVFLICTLEEMLIWIIIISLLLVGLALTIIELFFIPGTTVVGLLGVVFSVAGIIVSYNNLGSSTARYILAGMLLLSVVAFVVSFRSGAWSKFSLKSSIDSKVNEGILAMVSIGDEGVTLSNLRPVGKAEFNQKAYEVKTTGSFVESGEKVKITQIESHQIVVEPIKKLI